MSARATTAGLLAAVLLGGLVTAEAAHANRLDDAGSALRQPGVWVHSDLVWLVPPATARRLQRRIRSAGVAVRVAVLPLLAVDESRGDPRAVARAIAARVDRPGLLVLVDHDGRLKYAASKLALGLNDSTLANAIADREGPFGEPRTPIADRLDIVVDTVRAAPSGPPQDFEPAFDPQGVPYSGGGGNDEPLAGVAFGSGVLGAMLGLALHFIMRGVFALAVALKGGTRA